MKTDPQPIRIGTVWYLNVHDETLTQPEWVQTDARLFNEGLQLIWRTATGPQATVVLDLVECDGAFPSFPDADPAEVSSMYSPTHPMADDDLGAVAARRVPELAEMLHPFKLVCEVPQHELTCRSTTMVQKDWDVKALETGVSGPKWSD